MTPLRVGIVGCGNISGIYFKNLSAYRGTEVVACADLDLDRAKSVGAEQGVFGMATEELLARDDVDLILNLTVPKAHAGVALKAIAAGKHVYNEKPLAISREDGKKLLDEAKAKGLLVGAAPDTFLGGGLQTCRELIDKGVIGEPIAGHAFMLCHGHESWHPSPEFYYERGGGPMFDMGPYYLTALISLMGPIRRVAGSTRVTFPQRTITSEPKKGKVIEVETPTHIAGIMDFASGAIVEITTSFDVWHAKLPCISIYGTEGSMLVPDPNGFGGEIYVRGKGDKEWELRPLTHGFAENSRGLGVLDMAYALAEKRPHRASGALAYHVLDTMHAFEESSRAGRHVELASRVDQPTPLDADEFAAEI
ncbi:MAG TPA: Gfo/Idh/MocA family oxidoreductase [Fimbriimonadaceae bacterium]|nr:Gfo/Idh/MocA family oxidoreductase [Fimbriimonadaceae bacterium]